jgi:hypothetical protein
MRPSGWERRIAEGWQFSGQPHVSDKIIRVTPEGALVTPGAVSVFDTDEQALAFVQSQAKAGSLFHFDCLKYVAMQKLGAK